MNCSRCSSSDLYQFETSPSVDVSASPLPLVCRGCGLISVGGEVVSLPPEIEEQAMSLARKSADVGKATREALESDKDIRIEKYFESVYRQAYLDGFFRSVSFYQHIAKEGRLGRIRILWSEFFLESNAGGVVRLRGLARVYDECDKLLNFGRNTETPDAKNLSHKNSTNEEGTTRVP